jgi:SAM-dependent methyltransferase
VALSQLPARPVRDEPKSPLPLGPDGRLGVVEKNPAMLAMTRRRAVGDGLLDRLDLREGDAAALPFPDRAFAFVGAAQVFEYVPDVAGAVREASRVLRPGGRGAPTRPRWTPGSPTSSARAKGARPSSA